MTKSEVKNLIDMSIERILSFFKTQPSLHKRHILLHSEHQVPKTDNITGLNVHCTIYKQEENNNQFQKPPF
jgi:hypothetical protein